MNVKYANLDCINGQQIFDALITGFDSPVVLFILQQQAPDEPQNLQQVFTGNE